MREAVDAFGARAYDRWSRDPNLESLSGVDARTLRTEQCAKSQCVSPSREGRVPMRLERDGRTEQQHRKADSGVLLGEADFPTTNPKPDPGRQDGAGSKRFSTESLILAQDERWRRA